MTSLSFDTIIPSFKVLGHFPSQRPWRASYLPVFNSFTHAYEPAIKAAASFPVELAASRRHQAHSSVGCLAVDGYQQKK
jgi:hypothetical protein